MKKVVFSIVVIALTLIVLFGYTKSDNKYYKNEKGFYTEEANAKKDSLNILISGISKENYNFKEEISKIRNSFHYRLDSLNDIHNSKLSAMEEEFNMSKKLVNNQISEVISNKLKKTNMFVKIIEISPCLMSEKDEFVRIMFKAGNGNYRYEKIYSGGHLPVYLSEIIR